MSINDVFYATGHQSCQITSDDSRCFLRIDSGVRSKIGDVKTTGHCREEVLGLKVVCGKLKC